MQFIEFIVVEHDI